MTHLKNRCDVFEIPENKNIGKFLEKVIGKLPFLDQPEFPYPFFSVNKL